MDSLNRLVAASPSGGQFLSPLSEQGGGFDCPIHRDHDYPQCCGPFLCGPPVLQLQVECIIYLIADYKYGESLIVGFWRESQSAPSEVMQSWNCFLPPSFRSGGCGFGLVPESPSSQGEIWAPQCSWAPPAHVV